MMTLITKPVKLKRRKEKVRLETLVNTDINEASFTEVSKTLAKQIDKEVFTRKYARVGDVLKLVGTGAFVAASLVAPGLPLVLKPFIDEQRKNEYEVWKRFNIPYLRRTLNRLAQQKFVEITEKNGMQVVKITESGKRRVLKYAIDELAVEKPNTWDGRWRLVSYDIPRRQDRVRTLFREYLRAWGFYPFHESAFLHAYPCEKQIAFLREYLGIGEYVRIFTVVHIENNQPFKSFFGL